MLKIAREWKIIPFIVIIAYDDGYIYQTEARRNET
jgi:hypothetical protein